MANVIKSPSATPTTEAEVPLSATAAPTSEAEMLAALDLEFKREQLLALRRQRAKDEAAEAKEAADREAARRQKIALGENVAKERANLERKQALCTHKQKRGETCVGGQVFPSGRAFFLCQSCNFTWTNYNDIPPHLRPGNQIGSIRRVQSSGTDMELLTGSAPPADPNTAPTIPPIQSLNPSELALAALRGEI